MGMLYRAYCDDYEDEEDAREFRAMGPDSAARECCRAFDDRCGDGPSFSEDIHVRVDVWGEWVDYDVHAEPSVTYEAKQREPTS